MDPEKKKYILDNIKNKSVDQLSKELGIRKKQIRRFLANKTKEGKISIKGFGSAYFLTPERKQKYFKYLFSALFFLILLLGVFIRISSFGVSRRTPDEVTYTHYAKLIAENGIEGTKIGVKEHHLNKNLWIVPPPTRVTYLYTVAAVMKISNLYDECLVAKVSCAFSIFSLIILALLGIRILNRWIAIVGLLFFAVSPMELALSMRAWQDGFFGFFSLVLVYFCCEITLNFKRKIWYILFLVIGTYSLLIKEFSSYAVYGLCVVWILWILLIRENAIRKFILFALVSVIGPIVALIVLIILSGGVTDYLSVMKDWMGAVHTNRYAIEYQNGPWWYFLQGFWILTPVCTILSLIGISCAFIRRVSSKAIFEINEKRRQAFFGIVFFMIVFTALMTSPPHLKNLRYISVIFGPFYLAVGFGIWCIVCFFRSKLSQFSFKMVLVTIIMACGLMAFMDYQNFKYFFINKKIPDLVNKQFLQVK